MSRKELVPFLVEFVAQFFHTFWCLMATFPASNLPQVQIIDKLETNTTTPITSQLQQPPTNDYFQNIFMPAVQAGTSVWMQILWSWKLSPAHFNPAVSLGFLVSGILKPVKFILFVIIQCISSVIAAFVVKAISGGDPGYIAIPEDGKLLAIACNEVIITGTLVFFVLCTAADETYDNHLAPIAIGFTVFQGILTAKVAGVACISPSLAIGAAVAVGGPAWSGHWLLWLSDLGGAFIAASFYMTFFANDKICWMSRVTSRNTSSSGRQPLHKQMSIKSDAGGGVEENEMLPRTNL